MPHHKGAAAPETSIPSIPSLLCIQRSSLASCTRPGTRAGKMLLHKKHGLVTVGVQYKLCVRTYEKGPFAAVYFKRKSHKTRKE